MNIKSAAMIILLLITIAAISSKIFIKKSLIEPRIFGCYYFNNNNRTSTIMIRDGFIQSGKFKMTYQYGVGNRWPYLTTKNRIYINKSGEIYSTNEDSYKIVMDNNLDSINIRTDYGYAATFYRAEC